MTNEFCAVTTFFNPAKFDSLLNNYHVFAENLRLQGVKLITVECAFNNDKFQIPESKTVFHLRSNSIMWQKERLINYAVSKLPPECKYFAWLDCDIIFTNKDWAKIAVEKLKKNDIIQLFKKVIYLPKGHTHFNGKDKLMMIQGVVWQKMIHRNWLQRRMAHQLPFSAPGFAWAARRDFFFDTPLNGIYDKNIIGSGDTFLVDCYFNSWDIHGFAKKFTPAMKDHMMAYARKLKELEPRLDYLPIDIWHLWHGSLKNRAYMDRHDIVLEYDYDPMNDIVLYGNVYEWASRKKGMHDAIKGYFHSRKEDDV
jgi:predicted glycosyltransferase involved in capsule biosynthesis